MKTIYPCLWQVGTAAEAADYYVKAFPNSKITKTTYYGEGAPLPKGSVMTIHMELNGQQFMLLNATPWENYTGALSLVVPCDTQEEIDHVWDALTSGGGEPVQCGWLKDKYGVSWQIVPSMFDKWMTGDPVRSQRAMQTLWSMVKLDIARIQAAYDSE